jgi:hypothetical protein
MQSVECLNVGKDTCSSHYREDAAVCSSLDREDTTCTSVSSTNMVVGDIPLESMDWDGFSDGDFGKYFHLPVSVNFGKWILFTGKLPVNQKN